MFNHSQALLEEPGWPTEKAVFLPPVTWINFIQFLFEMDTNNAATKQSTFAFFLDIDIFGLPLPTFTIAGHR